MPLYEYECESCGSRFERIQKFSDPPVSECPKCGSGPVRKLLSSPAIQFKGSGFYITDYPKAGSGEKGGAAAAGKSSAEKTSEKSAEKSESTSSSGDAVKPAESKPADTATKPAKTSSE